MSNAPDFTPAAVRPRHDGWTPERQRAFIEALADCGNVSRAAWSVQMTAESAYRLRRHPQAESFRRAWNAALDVGVQRLTDVALERAIEGVATPVFYKGEVVGERRRYNDRLLMFTLRHHDPARYSWLATHPGFEAAERRVEEDLAEALLELDAGPGLGEEGSDPA